jgi:hypothetical protein
MTSNYIHKFTFVTIYTSAFKEKCLQSESTFTFRVMVFTSQVNAQNQPPTDYAVRVLLALAQSGEGAHISSAELQQEMLIPPALMTRIVAQSAHEGLVYTFPGRDV